MQKKKENSLHSVANGYLCLEEEHKAVGMVLDNKLHFVRY